MTVRLDRRWLRLADVTAVDPAAWFAVTLPELIRLNGDVAGSAADRLVLPPLDISVVDQGVVVARGRLARSDGRWCLQSTDPAFTVEVSPAGFSDWVNWIANFQKLMISGDMTHGDGSLWSLAAWELVLRTLTHGVPVHEPGSVSFTDRHGEALDLHRAFTPDDDPLDVAHFLREAGFLHLRGWLDPDDLAVVADDIDRAVSSYRAGDQRSWWATLDGGEEVCVRMLHFVEHSERTAQILCSDRWERLRLTLAGDEELVQPEVTGNVIEALIKPLGVVVGISDVPWHRDCSLGGHPYRCGGLTLGISVTPGTADTGLLRVVAGSHRAATADDPSWKGNDLQVVPLATEVGDITVHIACTIHEALPPRTLPRKVMYTNFALPDNGDAREGGALRRRDMRNEAHTVVSQPSNATRDVNPGHVAP